METLLQAHPGLSLAGNSYRGVSINSCIGEADRHAELVVPIHRRERNPAAGRAQRVETKDGIKKRPCTE